MGEADEVVNRWTDSGILRGLRWAFQSATDRTAADCNPAAGHSPTSIGATRHALFSDRLDRVFTCGRYDLPAGEHSEAGLDLVYEELTAREVATMPPVPRSVVSRADVNGSAGWTCGSWRWLLASAPADELLLIPWSMRSPTKQRVARQASPQQEQTLFDASPELHDWLAAATRSPDPDMPTLVVAYSHDVVSNARRVGVGRPRFNEDGGPAWHWWHELPGEGDTGRGENPPGPDITGGPDAEPDAPVRLRTTNDRRKAEGGDRLAGSS